MTRMSQNYDSESERWKTLAVRTVRNPRRECKNILNYLIAARMCLDAIKRAKYWRFDLMSEINSQNPVCMPHLNQNIVVMWPWWRCCAWIEADETVTSAARSKDSHYQGYSLSRLLHILPGAHRADFFPDSAPVDVEQKAWGGAAATKA